MSGALLTQCVPRDAEVAADGARGLVITGPTAVERAVALRESGCAVPLRCDAGRYAGTRRAVATSDFSSSWLACQRAAGLPVLTDSGYVGMRDLKGLRSVLRRAMRLGDVVAVLPLHVDWLRRATDLDVLLAEVTGAGVPVAVVLEHAKDPLGSRDVVRGLCALIDTGVPVRLLRSDVSALGALCHGAVEAAVGTSTALRHLYPVPTRPGGGRRASTAVFVPRFLGYLSVDKVATAVQRTPELEHLWTCECSACGGRTVDHFATVRDERERGRLAFRHSRELLGLLHDEFSALDRADREKAWHEQCLSAGFLHLEVRERLPEWSPPPFLNAWTRQRAPVRG
ncbi:hypothetical protein [Actinosynnema sp. NPDC020468]|uniref:hypothetical protein n=1 Tax=Actinosynnema sp. NPDC020468 TaxID=3154488 RepID=UPI00340ABF65